MAKMIAARDRAASAFRRIGGETGGAVMLEFAFVVIPFVALILASLYTSLIFFTAQALETTGQKSARAMITGSVQKAGTTQSAFKTQVCASLPTFMKCNRLFVDVRKSTSFASLNMAAPVVTIDADGNVTNSGDYQLISKGDKGMVRLAYVWYAGSGPNGLDLSNTTGGNRILVATSVFMAEPFGS
jgi:Flp pilus assembly protein TadG